jgi:hypothetical protein
MSMHVILLVLNRTIIKFGGDKNVNLLEEQNDLD